MKLFNACCHKYFLIKNILTKILFRIVSEILWGILFHVEGNLIRKHELDEVKKTEIAWGSYIKLD